MLHTVMIYILVVMSTILHPTVAECPRNCHCSRYRVTCSNTKLSGLPQMLRNGTETLVMMKDYIKELRAEMFANAGLDMLNTLVLNEVNLRKIHRATFQNMSRLVTLAIVNNKIESTEPETFRNLHTISKLSLYNNSLTVLHPSMFKGLVTLKKLYLNYNRIKNLPVDVFKDMGFMNGCESPRNKTIVDQMGLRNRLDLSHNLIEHLEPGTFEGLCVFTELYLNDNRLRALQGKVFVGLTNIRNLVIRDNFLRDKELGHKVQTLHTPIFQGLENIQEVDLRFGRINNIDDGVFINSTSLKYLDISFNPIEILRNKMFDGLVSLTTMRLSRAFIPTLQSDVFQGLSNITLLDLSGNRIDVLCPGVFRGLRLLKTLILKDNKIHTVQPGAFRELFQLQELDLSENSVSVLESEVFKELFMLRILNLGRNEITTIEPGAFKGLDSLKSLNLMSNTITSINNETFSNLSRLDDLDLSTDSDMILLPGTLNGLQLLKSISLPARRESEVTDEVGSVLRELLQGVESIQHFKVTGLNAVLQPQGFVGFHFLTLDLSQNNFPEILANAFLGISALNILKINEARIQMIHNEAFMNLQHLTMLTLSRNEISMLTRGIFHGLKSLQVLDLESNEITGLDEGVFGAVCNKYLYECTYTKRLTYGTRTVGEPDYKAECDATCALVNLRRLILAWNKIAFIHPNTFIGNEQLQVLILYGNEMLTLQTNFLSLPSLTHLDVSWCNVSDLPTDYFRCTPKVTSLDISFNNIESVGVDLLEQFDHLVTLKMHGNLLECNCQLHQTWYRVQNQDIQTDEPRSVHCDGENWNDVLSTMHCNSSERMFEDAIVHVFQVPPLSFDDASFKYSGNNTARYFKLNVEPFILWTIFGIGTIGNGLILLVFAHHPELCKGPDTCILNLAIGDILSLVVNIPLSYFDTRQVTWSNGEFFCKIFMSMRDVSVGITVFCVVMLSIHRYRLIVRSFERNSGVCGMSERSTIRLSILIVWALALGFAFPAYLTAEVDYMCIYVHQDNEYIKRTWTLQFVLYCAIPVFTITYIYARTARYLKESIRNVKNELQMTRQFNRRTRLANMVVILTVVFSLSYIPNFLIRILVVWSIIDPHSESTFYLCFVSYCLFFCNSCFNPIALFCVNSGFKDHFRGYLEKCCKPFTVHRKPHPSQQPVQEFIPFQRRCRKREDV